MSDNDCDCLWPIGSRGSQIKTTSSKATHPENEGALHFIQFFPPDIELHHEALYIAWTQECCELLM